MEIENLDEVVNAKRALETCCRLRAEWSRVPLNDKSLVSLFYDGLVRREGRCSGSPSITIDEAMQSAIVQAVVAEYDKRIGELQKQFDEWGISTSQFVHKIVD